ncbi:MAG: hypothetical protein MUP71_11610 [Candidatus Aminicenantes bacterium]|nr:hypothetical protein [Candidatus Aminicenantes bacterium]
MKRSASNKTRTIKSAEKSHTYLLRGIPESLWRVVKSYAGQNGTTVREIILTALREKTK